MNNDQPNLSEMMKRNPAEESVQIGDMIGKENLQKAQETIGMQFSSPKVDSNGQVYMEMPDNEQDLPPVTKGVPSTFYEQAGKTIQEANGTVTPPVATKKTKPVDSYSENMRMLTPEEAAQLGPGTPIDVMKETQEMEERKYREASKKPMEDMTSMINDAMKAENERLERQEEILKDPEKRKEVFQGNDPAEKTRTVRYMREYEEMTDKESEQEIHTKEVKRESYSPAEDIDFDEFVPAYDDEEEETEEPIPVTEESVDTVNTESYDPSDGRPQPEDSTEEEYATYLKSLQTATAEPEEYSAIQVVKDRNTVKTISSGRLGLTKNMQDNSFLNAVAKFKKDNFRTVSVPLVNSGFVVDIVGTGAVDINMLYSAVDQNITAAEYETEKMRVVMQNVVGTHPKVPKNDLRNMIHSMDYQLMAYGHVAATLKEIETIQTCPECGNDFHILCNASDLILNMDELRARMDQIRQSNDISDYSLMLKDTTIETPNGFTVQLGHPSYSDYIQYNTELKTMYDNMSKVEILMLAKLVDVLPFVRSVTIPNGVHTSTLYQRYVALGLLDEIDLADVRKGTEAMQEKILQPRFGIKRVVCPCCGKVNTNIEFDSLDSLLFFHTTVVRLMSLTEN